MKKRWIVTSSGKRILWKQGQDFGAVESRVGHEDFEIFYAKNVQDLKEKQRFSILLDTFEEENPGIHDSVLNL